MKILVGFEMSGVVRRAISWYNHEVYSCDLLPSMDNSPFHIQDDFRYVMRQHWDAAIMFPPCTHLSVSGARHFEAKRLDGRQQSGIDLFMSCVNNDIPITAIENPIGIMSRLYRKPDQ